LKAQADKRAADKRKSGGNVIPSQFKEFNERQEAQLQKKKEKLAKARV